MVKQGEGSYILFCWGPVNVCDCLPGCQAVLATNHFDSGSQREAGSPEPVQRHQRESGLVVSVVEERNKGKVPSWGLGISRDHTPRDAQVPYIRRGCATLMMALLKISRSYSRHRKSHTWAA